MTSTDQQEPNDSVDAEYQLVLPMQEDVPGIATYHSLARLLIGAILMGGDEILQRIQAWERDNLKEGDETALAEGETSSAQLRYALVGFLFEAPEAAARGMMRTAEMAESMMQSGQRVLNPVVRSRLFSPVRRRGQKIREQLQTSVDRWVDVGRTEARVSRAMVQVLTPQLIDEVVTALADDEAIQNLIRVQAGDYLTYLDDHPEDLEQLVQNLGDWYVKYLRYENPDDVQDLIAGQTIGLTSEVANQVRERTVTADSIVEMFVRALLRRAPRQDLPGPPSEVQELATFKGLEKARQRVAQGVEHDEP